ncbi:MAG TPA: hypothetical protein PLX69_21525 [Leptospiraceae bacterium]|nr:hypothetical protein [Leptospiraceae bacterium]
MTNKELKNKIIESVEQNHINMNSLLLVRPSEDDYIRIGKIIYDMLKTKDIQLPMLFDGDEDEVTRIQELTPVLYLSVNAS